MADHIGVCSSASHSVLAMSSIIRRHSYGIALFVTVSLTILTAHFIGLHIRTGSVQNTDGSVSGSQSAISPENESTDNYQQPAYYLTGEDRAGYGGFTIEKRTRKIFDEAYGGSDGNWFDVEYLIVKRNGKILQKFDADVYSGLGNSADFAFFPFLAGNKKQIFISQDVFRGGCQWVVSLSPKFKIIFDGNKLGVGREAYDLSVADLDKDGTQEIIVPITAFYDLQDTMSTSAIPLPNIVFKYDANRMEYFPANPLFKETLLGDLPDVPPVREPNELNFEHRSVVLGVLLDYVYAGEEKVGWQYYEREYRLADKNVMRQRVREILRRQPVYKLIYRNAKKN